MPYEVKPLACDPTAINGMSERLIVSHYENNYGGAVQRLNAITKELAELDFTSAPIFNWPNIVATYARLAPIG